MEVERRSLRIFCLRISHPRSGNYCVCDGGVHTLCRTHNFLTHCPCLANRHRSTRMAQGVCSTHVVSLHLILSFLMFHPPSLLFRHGHFETTFLPAQSLPDCTRSESADQAHFCKSGGKFGYLADPTHSTRCTLIWKRQKKSKKRN